MSKSLLSALVLISHKIYIYIKLISTVYSPWLYPVCSLIIILMAVILETRFWIPCMVFWITWWLSGWTKNIFWNSFWTEVNKQKYCIICIWFKFPACKEWNCSSHYCIPHFSYLIDNYVYVNLQVFSFGLTKNFTSSLSHSLIFKNI